jgi:sulfur carrier protein
MRIIVNGTPREVAEGTSVSNMLAALELSEAPVIVARNGAVVHQADQPATQLCEDDRLEIFRFVAGG